MRTFLRSFGLGCSVSLATLAVATPAFAQDQPPAVTISGGVTVVSDYRFRGISQTDKTPALQGSMTVAHESGFYASVWGSSVRGYVVANGNTSQELDLILGFKKTFGGTTFDAGLLYYAYPKSGPGNTNFAEPYVAISQAIGPVTAKATVAYAPKQRALALDQVGARNDNVYLAGDLSAGIPGTPVSVSAHIGHTLGPSWLSIGKEYTDYSVGASATFKSITVGVQYVDADGAPFITPSGKDAANGAVVATVGVTF